MKVSYFPGCTLKNKARDLDDYAVKSAKALGIELEEIDNWQCCGGVFTTAKNEVATKLSSVRALKYASDRNQPLVSVCSACHNVIKQTNNMMQTNKEFADKVNRYMPEDEYHGQAEVYHYLEMLRDIVGFDTLKEKVQNSMKGKKIGGLFNIRQWEKSDGSIGEATNLAQLTTIENIKNGSYKLPKDKLVETTDTTGTDDFVNAATLFNDDALPFS